MNKIRLTKKLAVQLLRSTSEEIQIDKNKVNNLIIDMNSGNWRVEESKNHPLALHHESKELVNGFHTLTAFLLSRLQSLEIYMVDNV
jgi:hypothetical protein